jgi:hypothetical protein
MRSRRSAGKRLRESSTAREVTGDELAPPATPTMLTVQAICAATGEVISQQHLVLHEPKRHGSRTSMWGGRDQSEPA